MVEITLNEASLFTRTRLGLNYARFMVIDGMGQKIESVFGPKNKVSYYKASLGLL